MGCRKETTLPGLPTEIIDDIVRGLADIDVASLHVVNRELFQKTKYAYAKRYFRNVHVFPHPISFLKLRFLTDDASYAPSIERITISTFVLRDPDDRRKGTSIKPWEDEKSFLESAAQTITNILKKATGLKALTISDAGESHWPLDMYKRNPWGINQLNQLVEFKYGEAVVTENQFISDTKMWPKRLQAFEAMLIGFFDAKLSAQVDLRLILEGNAPRPLSPKAQPLFAKALSSAAHLSTNVDTYSEVRKNLCWLSKINPVSLSLNYETNAWEAPWGAPGLQLGHFTRLSSVRICYAKVEAKELNDFLVTHLDMLRHVELKNICLKWENDYPWKAIFSTLSKIPALQYLWVTTLSAYRPGNTSRHVDYRAIQEVGWANKMHVSRGLQLLCDYYNGHGATDTFVDMHYVDEKMMELYGITI